MMQHNNDNDNVSPNAANLMSCDLWDEVSQLIAKWIDPVRSEDHVQASAAEQELRFFALFYASLPIDADTITTGRKAVLRSLYDRLGNHSTHLVSTMLDSVIAREERAARQGAGSETDR